MLLRVYFLLVLIVLVISTALADIDIGIKKKKKTKKGHVARDDVGKASSTTTSTDGYTEKIQAFQNLEYKGTVSVGQPPQVFEVIMDTGSDVFWLPRVGCTSSGPDVGACQSGRGLYDPTKSQTAVDTHTRFTITYGTGSASGDYFSDIMSFGDASANHVDVGNVTLGAATRITFSDEGILGLSFAQQGDPTPIFQLAVQRGVFSQPVFSVYLADCDADCEDGGLIKFGGVDTQHCNAVVGTANVVGQTPYWLFELSGISVAGQAIRMQSSGQMRAIVDTGTSIIAGPMTTIRQIASALGAQQIQGTYLVACNAQIQLQFLINGQQYTVTSAELILAGTIASDQTGQDYCQLAIDGDNQLDFLILGSPFIRAYCLVHNVQDKTIGFAPVKTRASNNNGGNSGGVIPVNGGGGGGGSGSGGTHGSGTHGNNWPFGGNNGNNNSPFGSSDPFSKWPFGNSDPFGGAGSFGSAENWPFGGGGSPWDASPFGNSRNSPFGGPSGFGGPFAGPSWGFVGGGPGGGDPFSGAFGSGRNSPWSFSGWQPNGGGWYDRPYKKRK